MSAKLEIDDGLIDSVSDMAVKLDVFEGPLDLLLFLIRKNEIDIYDIPIAEVTRQYMSVLRSMEKLSLDVAGEFFVMAATLMYIKSRMLLPSDERLHQENEEDFDADYEDDSDITLIVVIIAAGVLVIVAAVITTVVVIKKKKSKTQQQALFKH